MKLSNLLLASCVLFLNYLQVFAQEITYSPQETFSKGLVSIFRNPQNELNKHGNGSFIVTGDAWEFDFIETSKKKEESLVEPEISFYENNAVVSKGKLILETPGGKAGLMGVSALNDQAIVFLRQKDNAYNRCYYQYYDKSCNPLSEPVLLSEKKIEEGRFGFFSCLISDNQQFICLDYAEFNMKKMDDREVSFEIFDRNLKSVDQGDYASLGIVPRDVLERVMTNNGSLIVGVLQNKVTDKGKQTNDLEKMKLCIQQSGKLSHWEYNIPYSKVSGIEMFVSEKNENILYLAGIGSEAESKVAFYVKYDLKDEKELIQVKNKISFDILMYETQKICQQDNGIVFIMERVFGGASTTMSMNTGSASTTPKDYFNTVLCFKIEEGNETVPWNTIIDKEQVFITSMGLSRFGSIKVLNSDENCFIFFNDNTANYDEQGNYIATEKSFNKFDGKQEKKIWLDDKGLAMVELRLSDGSAKRTLIVRNKGIVNLKYNDCFVFDPSGRSAAFFVQKNELGQIGFIRF